MCQKEKDENGRKKIVPGHNYTEVYYVLRQTPNQIRDLDVCINKDGNGEFCTRSRDGKKFREWMDRNRQRVVHLEIPHDELRDFCESKGIKSL